jgi:glycosyltransferase involved in cell wall biosynthesis
VILTIGRLWSIEAEKGHDRIMRCLPELRKSFPRIRYLIGGRGDDRKRLEKLAADLDVNDRVTFCGFIHDEELCTHYNLCDIYAMPSTQEGFGIVYLEAMACGKPVLGSNADAAVDALCHGDLGFLVDPQDTGALSGILSGIFSGKYASDPRTDSARLTSEVRSRFGPEKFRENVARLWPSRPFQAHR